MSRRRNQNRKQNANNNQAQGLQELAPSRKPKKSVMDIVGSFIQGASSHKGQFWLASTLSVGLYLTNSYFYAELFNRFGAGALTAITGGLFTAAATTYVEVAPVVRTKSARTALETIYRMAWRPQNLPKVSNQVYKYPEALRDRYRSTELEYEKGQNRNRWVVIAGELFVGFLFLGNLGTGIQALGKLILFVLSVFGLEHTVVMVLRAYELELPPEARAQLNKALKGKKA
jgi:hypothetical protein